MSDRVPSFFLLVPGPWHSPAEVVDVLAAAQLQSCPRNDTPLLRDEIRVDIVRDDGFAPAMSHGRAGRLDEALLERIGACDAAALVEIGALLSDDPRRIATLGRALQTAGGVAVRNELSGGSSSWEPWLQQLESDDPVQLIANAVTVVADADGTVFTCGMHHFDHSDAQIKMPDPGKAIDWLDTLSGYQLEESATLRTGDTFRPDSKQPRRVLERWPDHRHHPDDGRHNPFGVWRILPAAAEGLEVLDPVPWFIPSLWATLLAAEGAKAGQLTQSEVDAVVDNCTTIATSQADVRGLELSRGYIDIEPRRAWPQWQLVREQ
ncbi:MAG: hypothetical protein JKY37_18655 [Nannocystaceae bacterium]|nr:hypothetical protein [Nannocystaceae bacterium]